MIHSNHCQNRFLHSLYTHLVITIYAKIRQDDAASVGNRPLFNGIRRQPPYHGLRTDQQSNFCTGHPIHGLF